MKDRELRSKQAKISEFRQFLSETLKRREFMENQDVLPKYPRRAKMARRLIDSRRKARLLSGTGNTSVQVTPDSVSIVFQSVKLGHTIHWPVSDWPELRKWLDSRLKEKETLVGLETGQDL